MAEPVFSETTERLYERLPDAYKSEDANIDYPFKRWLSGVGDVLGDVDTLITRFDYTPPEDGTPSDTSDLVDPDTADEAWLPWLAQLVGVKLNAYDTLATHRMRIGSALSGIKAGTKTAVAEAAKRVLTGTKTVYVYDHSTTAGIAAGGQWDVLVLTVQGETISDPLVEIIKAGAKPAGIKLWHMYFGAQWGTLEVSRPTWTDWETVTWQQLEETGL